MKHQMRLLVAIGAFVLGATAYAHHSIDATYLTSKVIKLEGSIVLFEFRNPHSFLHIEVPEQDGTMQRWGCP